jgi:hypothetical protein
MKKIREQVTRLKSKYPDNAVSITLDMWNFRSNREEISWRVYVEDKLNKQFKSFKEIVTFIDMELNTFENLICDTIEVEE